MAENDLRLKRNPFTELGFEQVDDLVAATLKRGSGRDGQPHIDITLESGIIAELPRTDVELVRELVDESNAETVDMNVRVTLSALNDTVQRARLMEEKARRS